MSRLSLVFLVVTLVSLLSLSTCLSSVSAFADGSGACLDPPTDLSSFLVHHKQPICPPTKSQFQLFTNTLQMPNSFIAGCKYTVSLCGPKPFKGFIVYAQGSTSTTGRIGTWSSPPSTPSHVMTCSNNPSGTITHSNANLKMNADFSFQMPQYIVGMSRMSNITIQARIVVSLSEWYITNLTLSYLNIANGMCPDTATLPLSVCPKQGILDTSGCTGGNITDTHHDHHHDHHHTGHDHDHDHGTPVEAATGSQAGATTKAPGHDHDHNHDDSGHDHGTQLGATTGSQACTTGTPVGAVAGHDHGHGTDDDHSMSSHGMSTIFTNNWIGIQLVFPGFTLKNTGAYIGALVVCFLVAFCVELIQWIQFRYDFHLVHQNQHKLRTSSRSDVKNTNVQMEQNMSSRDRSHDFTLCQQMSRSCFHLFRVFLSIFLMIIWMTLNVGLVISALAGSFIGFFAFSSRRQPVAAMTEESTFNSLTPMTPSPLVKLQQSDVCC